MSRSQKRQSYGFSEYSEPDFVGLRENSNQGQGQGGGRYYANGGRGGGGRGGGMRKQQQQQNLQNAQPRTFYVNAEFLQQNASEFQNAITMNGIRRRIGWGGVLDNDPCNINIGRHQVDIRPHANAIISTDIRLEDHCETSRDTITDLSVTVPTNRRSEEERGGGGGFGEFGNNGNSHARDKGRPRSRPANNNDYSNNNNSSNFRKKRRRSESEPDARRGGGGGGHKDKRHKKSRRPRRVVRDEDDQDSGDMRLSSVSDELEIDEEDDHREDLRNTIVRQKSGRNKFRREPGEILDTDESSPSSSPKAGDNKDRRSKSTSSRKKPSTKDAVVSAPVSTLKKNKEDSVRASSSPELDIVGDSRPITAEAETPTKNKEDTQNNKESDSVPVLSPGLEVVEDSRPLTAVTAETPTKEKPDYEKVVTVTPLKLNAGVVNMGDSRPTTAETLTPSRKITEITNDSVSVRVSREPEVVGSSRPTSAEALLMEAKIKALRGRRTIMENEIEGLKKNLSKSERHTKDVEQKLKKAEQELKLKQEEVESLKRQSAAANPNDPNKPDVQLIYAMAYQDRLFVEVEKVKSAFEIEVLKLQEYYESRLAHYRNQGLNPGAFLSGNNFPKGCVVTPLNIGQQLQVGHQDQNGMPRSESRSGQQQLQQQSQQMGLFAHLGNPDAVAPPIINIPQGISRARLPIFLNPMMRRLDSIQTLQQQPTTQAPSSISNSAPSNSNNNNCNSSTHTHNTGSNSGMAPGSHNSSFGRQ